MFSKFFAISDILIVDFIDSVFVFLRMRLINGLDLCQCVLRVMTVCRLAMGYFDSHRV